MTQKLAVRHRPQREDERREDDGIGHQNDELLRRQPAHVAHRQPEAVPEEPEEQRVDALQVASEPNLRWSDDCLNFHHFDSQNAGHLERVMMDVYPRLFEISSLCHSEHCTDTNMFPIHPIIRFT